jgi:hypothetical protein
MRRLSCFLMMALSAAALANPAAAADVASLLKTLQAVGPQGAGQRDAAQAWGQLARTDASQLPTLLAALDQSNPLAANWIRTAADAIAERQMQAGGKLPAAELEQFLFDRHHASKARRFAFELLVSADPAAQERLLPQMLDDPSPELRGDAVARLVAQADSLQQAGRQDEATAILRRAFAAARDPDQVKSLAERLKKLNVAVDLARHLGFVTAWHVIGPFDNTGEKGFDVAYPPEREINLAAAYEGKKGSVKWIEYSTQDEDGKIDLHKPLSEQKGVIAYATAEFFSEKKQEVEFRMAAVNALKLWLNGRLVDEHKVYHSGLQLDMYVSRASLEPGRNVILVKVCQNEQTDPWTKVWGFQLRMCDPFGAAVLSVARDKSPAPTVKVSVGDWK